ncbi:DUF3103 domain-containing protein [Streptomyces caniferus]|uniref:DUF3103 family protein n=1 Tax=Streptomyces caniferus TaxID=285557 RepID=UPI002E2D2FED|nr:DUF3103 family protein [Streptomyces caniferus]
MNRSGILRTAVAVAASSVCLTSGAAGAWAQSEAPAPTRLAPHAAPQTGRADAVQDAKQAAALSLREAYAAGHVKGAVAGTLAAADDVHLDRLPIQSGNRFRASVASANSAILAAKGLPASTGNVLQVRLANPQARAALAKGVQPLIATEPSDRQATSLTAYRPDGTAVQLGATAPVDVPVLLVTTDSDRIVAAGTKVMSEGFRAARPQTGADSGGRLSALKPMTAAARHAASRTAPLAAAAGHRPSAATRTAGRAADAGGKNVTRINDVRLLKSNEETFWKGGAEAFALVSGWDKNDKAFAEPALQMPYLDDVDEDYRPQQNLIDWSHFGYDSADLVFLEEDDGTNYRDLTKAIVDALLTVTGYGTTGIPLANTIMDAIPDKWWTDDTDELDQVYSVSHGDIAKAQSSGAAGLTYRGAGGNISIGLGNAFIPKT